MPLTGPSQFTPGWDIGGPLPPGITLRTAGQVLTGQEPPPPATTQPSTILAGGAQIPVEANQPSNWTPQQPTNPASQLIHGSNAVDPSLFLPGIQQITNSAGGYWPVQFDPVDYNPFKSAGNISAPGSGMHPLPPEIAPMPGVDASGGRQNNNLATALRG